MGSDGTNAAVNSEFDLARLARTRDLILPDWGPYSAMCAGVSHRVREQHNALDFLFAFRSDAGPALLPAFGEAGNRTFHAWSAAPDLSEYTYKFDLIGLDDFYALVRFDSSAYGCKAEVRLVNQTNAAHAVQMEIVPAIPAGLKDPPQLRLGPRETWLGAEQYAELACWPRRADDGYRNLVRPDRDAVDAMALSGRWAMFPGSKITWRMPAALQAKAGYLGIRYCKEDEAALKYLLSWNGLVRPVEFPHGAGYRWLWMALDAAVQAENELMIQVDPAVASAHPRNIWGQTPEFIQLDGFVLAPAPRHGIVQEASFRSVAPAVGLTLAPSRFAFATGPGALLHAVVCPPEIHAERAEASELFSGQVGQAALRGGSTLGCVRVAACTVPAQSQSIIPVQFCCGRDGHELARRARQLDEMPKAAAPPAPDMPSKFAMSRQLLGANCRMGIIYPIALPRETIATHSPGKYWNSLYAWDSGMHAIGLLESDGRGAVESLNTYLCGPEEEADFMWHGTPVPTQAYLANEIWQRTGDRDLLRYFYPRLKKFYEYLAGRARQSTTNRFGNGLLNTFPVFYNAGGWDDLPPQLAMHKAGLADAVTPVAPTAHLVRFARFLKRFALELGLPQDVGQLEGDMRRSLEAIERTWDEAAGVYSMVYHETFAPYRHASGENFNHTLDAMMPLLSGGVDGRRAAILIKQLHDPGRFLTAMGFSTVDQSAPYYQAGGFWNGDTWMPHGYWNGSVWMPHQWLLWKALLDCGDVALAHQIPRQIAELWERECRRTHCSFEYFRISTGQGSGYPHFAGLSAPVLNMIAAISEVGRVTAGFDTEIRAVARTGDRLGFMYRVDGPSPAPVVLAVMPHCGQFQVCASQITSTMPTDDLGCLTITLPATSVWTAVTIEPESPMTCHQ